MNSVICTSPLLLALLVTALIGALVAGRGKRLTLPAWLVCMAATSALVVMALVMGAELREVVVALLLLTGASLFSSALGRGEKR